MDSPVPDAECLGPRRSSMQPTHPARTAGNFRREPSRMAEPPLTRVTLLTRLKDGADADAWREFVHLYGPVVYGFARKRGLQDADAADLMQEVLRSVARNAEQDGVRPEAGHVPRLAVHRHPEQDLQLPQRPAEPAAGDRRLGRPGAARRRPRPSRRPRGRLGAGVPAAAVGQGDGRGRGTSSRRTPGRRSGGRRSRAARPRRSGPS